MVIPKAEPHAALPPVQFLQPMKLNDFHAPGNDWDRLCPGARDAQFATVAVELLGVGVVARLRFAIGLLLLKRNYGLADEDVCHRTIYDPYFQFFRNSFGMFSTYHS